MGYLRHRTSSFKETFFESNGSLLDLSCTAAELADGWTDGDTGEAVSTAETNAPGADPMTTVWSFDTNTSADTDDYCRRDKDVGSVEGLGNTIVISFSLYHDLIGTFVETDFFGVDIRRSDWRLLVNFCSDGLYISGASYNEVGTNLVSLDTWQEWTFVIDLSGGGANAVCDVYLDNVLQASDVDCSNTGSYTDGLVRLDQFGRHTDDQISYLDWLKIGDGFV